MDSEPRDDSPSLAAAHARIAAQQLEIERLRADLATAQAGAELRDALAQAAAAGTIGTRVPHQRLLQLIVEAAARVINAQAASLFMLSDDGSELIFEVAIGPRAEQAKQFRVPVGQGIAGLVAVTGQAMAVSDVQHDPRHASDLARQIGYRPQSILCVPLFYDDEVIGVLELMDKTGQRGFRPEDIETLGLFANLAAVAIGQSRTQNDALQLVQESVSGDGAGTQRRVAGLAGTVQSGRSFQRGLALAGLVQEIAARGEAEQQACEALLSGFAAYLRSRDAAVRGLGGAA